MDIKKIIIKYILIVSVFSCDPNVNINQNKRTIKTDTLVVVDSLGVKRIPSVRYLIDDTAYIFKFPTDTLINFKMEATNISSSIIDLVCINRDLELLKRGKDFYSIKIPANNKSIHEICIAAIVKPDYDLYYKIFSVDSLKNSFSYVVKTDTLLVNKNEIISSNEEWRYVVKGEYILPY